METDATDLGDITTETAFITEDMLQSIHSGRISNLNSLRALSNHRARGNSSQANNQDTADSHTCLSNRRCHNSASSRGASSTLQHGANRNSAPGDESGSGSVVANDNEAMDTCINGNVVNNSNRSSVESNHCNNLLSELLTFHSHQDQDMGSEMETESRSRSSEGQAAAPAHVYENVQVGDASLTTIEVEGVTNTSSSDCCVQNHHSNRNSDVSLPSDLSAGSPDAAAADPDASGAAGGAEGPEELDSSTSGELSDILFRFDRHFRMNTGFGFANWRWTHRLSNQSAGSRGSAAAGTVAGCSESSLQRQARWLKRLQAHQCTTTPTNSNSNSLRSTTSSGSSSSVRGSGGNLQQEWYFYDPRLVPQNRTQRIAVQTNHNRIQTTSYVSNIVNPPTYEELANLGQQEVLEQPEPSMALLGSPGAPPAFEDSSILPNLPPRFPSPGGGQLPADPPPPYVDSGRAPVYDVHPSELMDPPPQYDDHSFSEDDDLTPVDPMDPNSPDSSQGENDNFILTQSTSILSEMDGNFILSAAPRITHRPPAITPDSRSIASENSDVRPGTRQSGADSGDDDATSVANASDGDATAEESAPIPLHLEELFRDPNLSREQSDFDLSNNPEGAEDSPTSNVENDAVGPLLPWQHHPNSGIFPGYQLLHNSPSLLPWSHHPGDDAPSLDDSVADDLDDDDLPEQDEDSSRSLANFSHDASYPAGFLGGAGGPPLRWSRGVGLGRWNAQNWAI